MGLCCFGTSSFVLKTSLPIYSSLVVLVRWEGLIVVDLCVGVNFLCEEGVRGLLSGSVWSSLGLWCVFVMHECIVCNRGL